MPGPQITLSSKGFTLTPSPLRTFTRCWLTANPAFGEYIRSEVSPGLQQSQPVEAGLGNPNTSLSGKGRQLGQRREGLGAGGMWKAHRTRQLFRFGGHQLGRASVPFPVRESQALTAQQILPEGSGGLGGGREGRRRRRL